MNENKRDEINYALDTIAPEIILKFISSLEDKTISLESKKIELKTKLDFPGTEIEHLGILLDPKKFDSSGELIATIKLLKEIRDLQNHSSNSTRLVCTKPDSSSEDTDETNLVLGELMYKAKESITIIGYLMTDDEYIKKIFQMIKNNPNIMKLKIRFVFDNVEQKQELGKKYNSIKEIIRKMWDENVPFPEIYNYKGKSASLHAKAVIIDSKEIFSTSANMSGRAIKRNFEMGICHIGKPAKDAEKVIDELIKKRWFERT